MEEKGKSSHNALTFLPQHLQNILTTLPPHSPHHHNTHHPSTTLQELSQHFRRWTHDITSVQIVLSATSSFLYISRHVRHSSDGGHWSVDSGTQQPPPYHQQQDSNRWKHKLHSSLSSDHLVPVSKFTHNHIHSWPLG